MFSYSVYHPAFRNPPLSWSRRARTSGLLRRFQGNHDFTRMFVHPAQMLFQLPFRNILSLSGSRVINRKTLVFR